MRKQILESLRESLNLLRDTQKNTDDIEEVCQELRKCEPRFGNQRPLSKD